MSSILDDFKNAFRRRDNALIQIIIINVVVFVGINITYFILWASQTPKLFLIIREFYSLSAYLPNLIYTPWTFISYFFAHEDVWHILVNMLVLYWFGLLIMEYLGSKRLISLYVMGGLAGGISYVILYNLIPQFHNFVPHSTMIGASGAVYGVMLGAATLMPTYVFHLLLVGPVQIKYIAAFFVFISFIEITRSNPGGNIAHLGGALMGYIYIVQLKKGRDLGNWIHNFIDFIISLFKKKSRLKVSYSSKSKVTTGGNYSSAGSKSVANPIPNQEEIDAILDKISESGYESLTKEEKQKLFKASKQE